MKKAFSMAITLSLMLLFSWAAMAWYFGERTEQEFKSVLENNNREVGEKLFRAELLSYRKTLVGANASLRISSDSSVLSERMGEFQITAKLLNGPLFITDSGIKAGSAHWLLSLDQDSIAPDELENLQDFFPDILPTAQVRLGFDKKAHYLTAADTAWFTSVTTGIFDLKTQTNRGSIELSDFKYGDLPNQLSAEILQLSYQHQKSISSAYKPGTTSIKIPALQINHQSMTNPLSYRVKANSNISSNNNELSGFIKVELINLSNNEKTNHLPINKAEMSLLFKGVSSDGFIQLSEAKAELDNLQQQSQWILEEQGELPEGQDQIWQLQDRMNNLSKLLPKTLKENIFNSGKSKIHFEVETSNSSGLSTLSGDIKPADVFEESTQMLSFFQSQAKVKLDNDLFQFLSKHTDINKKQFTLIYLHNKLLMQ